MCHGGGGGGGGGGEGFFFLLARKGWKGFPFSIAMKIYRKIWNKKAGLSYKNSPQHDFVAGTSNKR